MVRYQQYIVEKVFETDDKHFDVGTHGLQELMQVTLPMNFFEAAIQSNA